MFFFFSPEWRKHLFQNNVWYISFPGWVDFQFKKHSTGSILPPELLIKSWHKFLCLGPYWYAPIQRYSFVLMTRVHLHQAHSVCKFFGTFFNKLWSTKGYSPTPRPFSQCQIVWLGIFIKLLFLSHFMWFPMPAQSCTHLYVCISIHSFLFYIVSLILAVLYWLCHNIYLRYKRRPVSLLSCQFFFVQVWVSYHPSFQAVTPFALHPLP